MADYRTETSMNQLNGMMSGAAAGAAALSWAGPVGSVIGGLLGGLFGGLFSMWSDNERYKSMRNDYMLQREEITQQRNTLIATAQQTIGDTRIEFDATYGEGMYDIYDELFQNILNLPSGTKTVSDLLESLSLDNVSGVINTEVGGQLSLSGAIGSISAADVNSAYLEYMQNQIRDADTLIGLQFQANSQRERSALANYYDSLDQYNLQLAQQFSNAFLQQRQSNLSLEGAMGDASMAQATSGIRQTGSGTNLTAVQKFQRDLSDVAYSSTLSYMIRAYGMQGETMNRNLFDTIYTIRNENLVMTKQFTNNFFSSMNRFYHDLTNSFYYGIKDAEESIDALNKEISSLSDAIGGGGEMHTEMEDLFLV